MAEANSEQSTSSGTAQSCTDAGGSGEPDFVIWKNPNWRMSLLLRQHIHYCRALLRKLPTDFEEYDTQRIPLLHFSVTSLDLMNHVSELGKEEIDGIRQWVHYLLITADPPSRAGFQGSSTFLLNHKPDVEQEHLPVNLYCGHLTMTYTALAILLSLGDDFSKIDRKRLLAGVAALQRSDGGFMASFGCEEKDLRFVYSAVCICYILNDFSLINVEALKTFIKSSMTYEGSFGSGTEGTEGHAAYTYCAVASLKLLGVLESTLSPKEIDLLTRWCLFRQEFGFTGRPNKIEDTCYSYWVGATLKILGSTECSDRERNVDFILSNQNPYGGIGKCDNTHPDPLHTFFGLAGLSLVNYEGLSPINPALTMSSRATSHLNSLQAQWK